MKNKKDDKEKLHTPAKDERMKKDRKWDIQDEFSDPSEERIRMEGKISNAAKPSSDSESSKDSGSRE